jgi:lysylphosphatidylglycerol synthetase-like protein (DUF2156 family)
MEKKNILAKILAIIGTVLLWLPVVAPFFFGLLSLIGRGRFRFDYLMPAELFFVVLAGAVLLIVAAILAKSQLKLIAWSFGIAIAILFIGQGLAMVTGLANGEYEPEGWRWALVLGSIIAYILAVISTGVGGILLLRDLFKRPKLSTAAN